MYQERTSTIFTEQDRLDRLRDLEAQERDRQIKQDAEKKNPPFVQLTRKRMPDLRKHNTVNPLAVNIFLFIAEHMGRDNILICSTSVLVEEMGKSRATVARAIKYLKDEKLLEAVKFGSCTGYAVSGEYVWTTFNQPGRYAVFENAKALASKSENKSMIKKLATAFKNSL
jgi:hypothetical protein